MSIEGSAGATGPKTVAGAESHGLKGKGKAKMGTEADALASGGFMALLASLEPQADVGVGVAAVADQSEAAAGRRPAVETLQTSVLTSPDPSSLLAQNLPNDVAVLLQQAGNVAGDKLSAGGEARPMGRGGVRWTAPAMGADKPELPVAVLASLGGEKPGDVTQYVDAMLDQSAQTHSTRPLKAGGAEFQSGAGASLAEARALRLPTLMDVSARDPAISGALVTSGVGDSFLRQVDRASAKSSVVAGGSGIEGLWGQQALLADRRMDAPPVMSDPSMLSLDSMVADTVSYWVTQGVQNAELKLDGFGGEPVEVTISLKGGEAHIDFRTDQPEVRQVLEGAVAHLKELLASEGLVLSGVSVGTSGQDGTGAQERRHGPDVRRATIATADAEATVSPKRVNQSAGRVVDLFV